MKKFVLGFALAATFAGFSSTASAATLLLRGQINTLCTLDAVDTTPYPGANTALPIVAGTSSTTVANAVVSCNNANGYRIEASSANGLSRLAHATQPGTAYTTYRLEVEGVGSTGFSTLSSTPTVLKQLTLSAPEAGATSKINVQVAPIATPALAGVYEDTVTLTLTAL